MQCKLNSRLSNRLFFAVMGTALLMGFVFSTVQISLEAQRAREQMTIAAHQTLTMMQEPATQAVLKQDAALADQVIDGLFRNQSVFYAAVSLTGQPPLASRFRNKQIIPHQSLVSRIFGLEYSVTQELRDDNRNAITTSGSNPLGSLEFSIDPTREANAFFERCITILISGLMESVVFGFVLYLIFQMMIARPMTSLLRSLEDIDPLRPSRRQLVAPAGHDNDELGAWVRKINILFKAIEKYNRKRRVAEAHVERLSNYDMLTELPNRNMLMRRIEQAISETNSQQTLFAVMFCALDDFKSVNLLHSYHAGDKLLLTLADRFRAELDPDYTIARVGGDVFAMVVSNLENHYQTADVAQNVLDCIRDPFELDGQRIALSATIGIALYPHDAETAEQLLKNSENVMQLAKSQGGNHYQFYVANVDQRIREAKALERDLSHAVDEQQLELVFQPQINLVSGQIRGAEALVRWHHPEKGIIYPDEFIPLAERTGTIAIIGEWVLETACRTLEQWHQAGFPHLTMSVNVSAIQLHQANLVYTINDVLEKSGVAPQLLILEITETAVMGNVDFAIRLLKQIKNIGVQLGIDDFGTGYSSLSYLKKMPMDELKIDQAFVNDMLEDPDNGTIVDAIIQLGHSLGLSVVAEGTESRAEIDYLQRCQCDVAQGYFYSKPVSSSPFLELLMQNKRAVHGHDNRMLRTT